MASFTDDFNRADGGLGANWESNHTGSGTLSIVSNAIGPQSPSDRTHWQITTAALTVTAAHYAKVDVTTFGSSDSFGVYVRGAAPSGSENLVKFISNGSGSWELIEMNGGGNTGLTSVAQSGANAVPSTPFTMVCEVSGNSVVGKVNGVQVISGTASGALTGGQPGITIEHSGGYATTVMDNFQGGDGTYSAASIVGSNYYRQVAAMGG